MSDTTSTAADLIARSNRLVLTRGTPITQAGTLPRRAPKPTPVTGEPVELLWVKGSAVTWAR